MSADSSGQKPVRPVLAIHGGAGAIAKSNMSAENRAAYAAALEAVLTRGQAMLAASESALDVVVEAVRMLEECELFNAGKGSVYTADGCHELDASVMDGATRNAGAVAGVTRVRNPILAAREVMLRSGHVMLAGSAADEFAVERGLQVVEPTWFDTPARLLQLRRAQAALAGQVLDHDPDALPLRPGSAPLDEQTKFGTVGAVACDASGHLAAATSTGGMTNKRPGRVGDSSILGAGCYADDASVAVSCTGTGEAFMRLVAGHEISALVRLAGLTLRHACERVIFDELPAIGGRGGLIGVDASGEVWLGCNTEGMYRGYAHPGEAPVVRIFGEQLMSAALT